ncbi:MAG TPA: helix-turn-helix transcriptional regulator [Pseudolabrys sp.]|jgi:hypothetical protein
MSFQITISASRRAAARFVVGVRRALQKAYAEEQKDGGLTQTAIANALGVHRSVINRELRGLKDITLGRVAELAEAMGRTPTFALPKKKIGVGSNFVPVSNVADNSSIRIVSTSAPSVAPANNNFAPVAIAQVN